MSTTSQKHRNFVAEPMNDKSVTDLAGIGEVLGKRLTAKGFDKAYVVLGQFLVLKKNRDLFIDWLKGMSYSVISDKIYTVAWSTLGMHQQLCEPVM